MEGQSSVNINNSISYCYCSFNDIQYVNTQKDTNFPQYESKDNELKYFTRFYEYCRKR